MTNKRHWTSSTKESRLQMPNLSLSIDLFSWDYNFQTINRVKIFLPWIGISLPQNSVIQDIYCCTKFNLSYLESYTEITIQKRSYADPKSIQITWLNMISETLSFFYWQKEMPSHYKGFITCFLSIDYQY